MCSQQNFDYKLNQLKTLNEASSDMKEVGFQVIAQVSNAGKGILLFEPPSTKCSNS